MMLYAPKFEDKTEYYADRNVETVFKDFNESLDNLRAKLGEERYLKMRAMSDEMRALFEADPEAKTGQTIEGCKIIHAMELMLRRKRAAPGSGPPAA